MGPAYAERRKRMVDQKAKAAAMRKLLVVVWAVHRSGTAFDAERVFSCQSQSPVLDSLPTRLAA